MPKNIVIAHVDVMKYYVQAYRRTGVSVLCFHFCVQWTDLCDLFMQDNDLSEFDESREIIESLVDEYKACESPDYIKWGMEVSLLQF